MLPKPGKFDSHTCSLSIDHSVVITTRKVLRGYLKIILNDENKKQELN
jgi:hypothetical protein